MQSLFARFCLVFLGGALIASAVSGNLWPVIIVIVALTILAKVFHALDGPGG